MALTRPILYNVSAFDATEEHIFYFNVIGGDQVTKNQLTIINQNTNEIVYQQTQTTFAFRHVVAANTLTNGQYYSASLITYNVLDESSTSSLSIQFYCYTNPSFEFTNIPFGNVISNSNYVFELTYNQTEGELLNSCTINLYDVQQSLITTSGIIYIGSSSTVPTVVSHTFSNLQDNTFYYIQATGQTSQGTEIITDLVAFSVIYTEPSIFSIINLTNNCKGGYIIIQSNLSEIPGRSNPYPPIFVDENTAIDLRGNGAYVIWDVGFDITTDFTASLWGRNFNTNSNIITFTNQNGNEVIINYRKNIENKFYAELFVKENNIIYYLYTNPIIVEGTDSLQIWFRRIQGLYEIGLYNLSRS